MSGDWLCNACGFRVPAGDGIGIALMKAHLQECQKCTKSQYRATELDARAVRAEEH